MMKGNIGLDAAMIKSSKTILNNLLADHFVLLAKTWNYHWNMKGPSFRSYHTFLEDLYNGLIEDIDSIAERVRDLDERPIGSLRDVWNIIVLKNMMMKNHSPMQRECWQLCWTIMPR